MIEHEFFLLDTNIVLNLLAGNHRLASLFQGKTIFLSFIVELELLSFPQLGAEEAVVIQSFVRDCIILDRIPEIKKHCLYIRQKYRLKLADSLIAATAMTYQLPLITADKDFTKLDKAEIEVFFINLT